MWSALLQRILAKPLNHINEGDPSREYGNWSWEGSLLFPSIIFVEPVRVRSKESWMATYAELGIEARELPRSWSVENTSGPVHGNVLEFLRIEDDGASVKYVGECDVIVRASDALQLQSHFVFSRQCDMVPELQRLVGPGKEDAHAASCRTDKPVPAGIGIYYFEVTIVSKVRQCISLRSRKLATRDKSRYISARTEDSQPEARMLSNGCRRKSHSYTPPCDLPL